MVRIVSYVGDPRDERVDGGSAMRLGKVVTTLAVMIGLLGIPACSSKSQSPPDRESVTHMWTHYTQVGEIQTALIRGDLTAAREPAEWISSHESLDGMPAGAESFTGQMRSEADRIVVANGIETAAMATGQMGGTCGSCHQAYDVGPTFNTAGEPPLGAGLTESQMLRHLWAADRLWEGLIGPSDEAWLAGAEVLADYPMYSGEVAEAVAQSDDVRRLAQKVQKLGTQAVTVTDQDGRAELYGRLLSTCSSCHGLMK